MGQENQILEKAYAEHIGEHYKRASEELLHAYQRNKEAGRHHEAGAFKAACTMPSCPSTTPSMPTSSSRRCW